MTPPPLSNLPSTPYYRHGPTDPRGIPLAAPPSSCLRVGAMSWGWGLSERGWCQTEYCLPVPCPAAAGNPSPVPPAVTGISGLSFGGAEGKPQQDRYPLALCAARGGLQPSPGDASVAGEAGKGKFSLPAPPAASHVRLVGWGSQLEAGWGCCPPCLCLRPARLGSEQDGQMPDGPGSCHPSRHSPPSSRAHLHRRHPSGRVLRRAPRDAPQELGPGDCAAHRSLCHDAAGLRHEGGGGQHS